MSLFKVLAFASLALGAVLPRTTTKNIPAGSCCFTLHDSTNGKTLQEDGSGNVYIDGGHPDGWFCLNLNDSYGILFDETNQACILGSEDRFLCLDPTPGAVTWDLEKYGGVALSHDNDVAYHACPSSTGEQIWGDKTECSGMRNLTLKAKGLQGTCNNFA